MQSRLPPKPPQCLRAGFQALSVENSLLYPDTRQKRERKRAEEELQRRAHESATLYDIARDLAMQQDMPRLLETIVEQVKVLLNVPAVAFMMYDPARGDLELVVATNTVVPIGTRLALGEGLTGSVAQNRETMILNDYQHWEQRAARFNHWLSGLPWLPDALWRLTAFESKRHDAASSLKPTPLLSLFCGASRHAVRKHSPSIALAHIEESYRDLYTMPRTDLVVDSMPDTRDECHAAELVGYDAPR